MKLSAPFCPRILVSGFEAFGSHSVNPTAQLMSAVSAGTEIKLPLGIDIRPVVLPVVFTDAFTRLESEIADFDPHAVVCFGQAGGRKLVDLERIAINRVNAEIPDNKGRRPRNQAVITGGPSAYFSTLPLRQLLDSLRAEKIDAQFSNSAGQFVCNQLLYLLLASNMTTARKCGLIHLPYLPEQTLGKEGIPSMPFATMCRAVEVILSSLDTSLREPEAAIVV